MDPEVWIRSGRHQAASANGWGKL